MTPHVPGSGAQAAPPTVLVLRALGLGDALTGVAALRGVRRAWPQHRLTLASPASTGHWLRSLDVVDEVLETSGLEQPLRWSGPGPDVAVDLHGRGPRSHRLLQATRPGTLVGYDCPEAGVRGPLWFDDEHEVSRWCRLVRSAGGRCSAHDLRLPHGRSRGADVVVHPGAASPARCWPVQRWAEVVATLRARGLGVLLTGGPDERELCARVAGDTAGVRDLSGTLDVAGLADLVAGSAAVLCGDTGVAHLATAFGTPSVVLFGPTPPGHWGPGIDPDRHQVLWRAGAGYRGDPHGREVDPALARVQVADVLAALDRLPPAA